MLLSLDNHLGTMLSLMGYPLAGGAYYWSQISSDYYIDVSNANNHQVTYAVLRAAVAALRDYMAQEGEYGTLVFDIWDGNNQVGKGVIDEAI